MKRAVMYLIVSLARMAAFGAYLREVLGFRRPARRLILWWTGSELANLAAGGVIGQPWRNALIYLLGLEVVAFGMCRGKRIKKAFLVLVYVVAGILCETICASLFVLFGVCSLDNMLEAGMISGGISLLVEMLLLLLTQLAVSIWKKHAAGDMEAQNWAGLFGMCGGCFAATVVLATGIVGRQDFFAGQVIVLVILAGLNYYFYTVSAQRTMAVTKVRMYESQVDMYRKYYESIQASRHELHGFRHDMKNHVNALNSLCQIGREEGKAEEILEEICRYIERIGETYLGVPGDADSGNLLLDAIIGTKKNYAASRGICIRAELQIPEGMKLDGVDTVILLGNLLDNAIEASEKTLEGVMPEIKVEIRYYSGVLYMMIRNTYDGGLDGRSSKDGKLLKTDKPDAEQHGIGIANILKVVEKYDGHMEWNAEDGIFTVNIMLYGFDGL